MCEYCIVGDYSSYCTCSKTDDICPYTYRCTVELRHKPTKGMKQCKLRKDKPIPKKAYKIRFEKKGKLFVEVDDYVIEFDNPFNYVPEYVYLTKTDKGYKIKKR